MHQFIHPCNCQCIYAFIHALICPSSIHPYMHTSIYHPSTHQTMHTWIHPPIHFTHSSIHPFIINMSNPCLYESIYELSVYIFTHLSIHPHMNPFMHHPFISNPHLCIHQYITHPSIYAFIIHSYTCLLSMHACMGLSIHQSLCQSMYACMHISSHKCIHYLPNHLSIHLGICESIIHPCMHT